MDTVVIDSITYTRAAKAARALGYATDYVGQLCRAGKVPAQLIGRTWYVDEEALRSHKHNTKRITRVKAREQARKYLEMERAHAQDKTRTQYEKDDAALIPEMSPAHTEEKIQQESAIEQVKEDVMSDTSDSEDAVAKERQKEPAYTPVAIHAVKTSSSPEPQKPKVTPYFNQSVGSHDTPAPTASIKASEEPRDSNFANNSVYAGMVIASLVLAYITVATHREAVFVNDTNILQGSVYKTSVVDTFTKIRSKI